jgi:hypothetical protein
MNKRSHKITVLSFCSIVFLGMIHAQQVVAEEIDVTDNGAKANAEVSVSNTKQTNTQQNNTASVENNVSTEASTGNNTASNTTAGSNAIQTGNASADTTITNEANKAIVTQNNCCQTQQSSVNISGNGVGSSNTVNKNASTTNTVSTNNNVIVTNNIQQNLSTGNNKANSNNGNVTIKTGNISSTLKVKNGPLNVSKTNIPDSEQAFLVSIKGNGAGSTSYVSVKNNNNTIITTNNTASIINNLISQFETGNNEANFNNGDVVIKTGEIENLVALFNGPINVSSVTTDCGCKTKEHQEEKPQKPVGGSVPTSSSTSPSSSAGSSSSPSSETTTTSFGEFLPITGNNFLILALFGNVMMLLLGAYLRLRSGNSPGFALAI